jgi:hypothetical protein
MAHVSSPIACQFLLIVSIINFYICSLYYLDMILTTISFNLTSNFEYHPTTNYHPYCYTGFLPCTKFWCGFHGHLHWALGKGILYISKIFILRTLWFLCDFFDTCMNVLLWIYCYAKIRHPWLEHIWLVSQSSHIIIYALQLYHFYDYSHLMTTWLYMTIIIF